MELLPNKKGYEQNHGSIGGINFPPPPIWEKKVELVGFSRVGQVMANNFLSLIIIVIYKGAQY